MYCRFAGECNDALGVLVASCRPDDCIRAWPQRGRRDELKNLGEELVRIALGDKVDQEFAFTNVVPVILIFELAFDRFIELEESVALARSPNARLGQP